MNDLHEKIKQNAKYILFQNLTTPLINLAIGIYIIKKLSVTDYGIYNLLYAVISYLALFSSMGLLNVLQRYIPEFSTKRQFSNIKKLFKYSITARFILAAFFLGILLLFSDQLNLWLKVQSFHSYISYFFIGIILFLEIQVVEAILSSLLLNRAIMISYWLATIVRAILIYVFIESNLGLKGLLLAETFYYAALLLSQFLFYYFGFSIVSSSAENNLQIRRLFRYSGFSYFDEIGWTILDVKTDFFIISAFLGPTMVGLYGFANQFVESISKVMPFKILRPLIRSIFFFKFTENNKESQLNRHFNFLVKLIAFISFPIFMAVMVIGEKIIIVLFDPKYLPALPVLWIFTGFMLIISFQFPLQLVVQAVEKVEITFYSKIFSIYNLIGDILIIRILGIVGVALVTCSARLFQFIFVLHYIKKHVPLKLNIGALTKIAMNTLVMTVVLYLLNPFVTNISTLILIVIFGTIIYFGFSFFNKSFFDEERAIINKLLPRPLFVF